MTRWNDRYAWASAIAIGALVLAVLFWIADPKLVLNQIYQANVYLLAFAVLPLVAEALFTSLRVQHCVNHPVPFSLATYCNALYIGWLAILPARLGEVVGIAVFHKRLNMPLGSAIASVIVQRIYDVLILSGLLVALLSQTFYGGTTSLLIACLVLAILMLVLFTLPACLGLAARLLLPVRSYRVVKRLIHIILQARSWYRHQSEPNAILWLAGTTLGKWLVNLVAITLVFYACGIELELGLLGTVAVLMHFLGAIPIQSFGGFGASEIGLAGILISLGISTEQAVATSLLIRIVSLSFAGLFFLCCFAFIRPTFGTR